MATLISHKVYFRGKKRDKKGYHITIKKIYHYEDIMILNVLAPNNRASNT